MPAPNRPEPRPNQTTPRKPATQAARPPRPPRAWLRFVLAAAGAYVLLMIALALYWCQQPARFEVAAHTAESIAADGSEVPGTAFVATTIGVAETLLGKPGGFLYNDRFPPGIFLDDCPSWECGVIMALRDAVQALRNDLSRVQTQSAENLDLKRAELQFAVDPGFWVMPAPEKEYRKGIDALRQYLHDLSSAQVRAGRFSARADNLAAYLGLVEKRLGNFGVRLSSSSGGAPPAAPRPAGEASRTSTAASFDRAGPPAAEHGVFRTEPGRVDDVFYCARGYSWALLHFTEALRIDFAGVLADKNAEPTLRQIARDLRGATQPMSSPIVLNGSGYGFLPNHSLVLGSYIARVNAAVIEMRLLLHQG